MEKSDWLLLGVLSLISGILCLLKALHLFPFEKLPWWVCTGPLWFGFVVASGLVIGTGMAIFGIMVSFMLLHGNRWSDFKRHTDDEQWEAWKKEAEDEP
jgi:hypothetical protein